MEEYDNNVCYTIGVIHPIDKNDYDDMQNHKLGDAMFNEYDMFEDLFAGNNACPKLGDALLNEYDPLIPSTFDKKIYYDDSMPPSYDNYNDESGFGRVSTLGNDPTILESVESYCGNYESRFGEAMTLFNDDLTVSEEVSIDYDNKVAIYDDYGDDMYAMKNNDNHETFHHDFNFHSHDSYFVEYIEFTSTHQIGNIDFAIGISIYKLNGCKKG